MTRKFIELKTYISERIAFSKGYILKNIQIKNMDFDMNKEAWLKYVPVYM